MTWWSYVVEASGTDSPKAMQARTGIDGPNFSRWKAGHVPKVDLVAKFARSYRKPVLEAFVAAGFLTPEEAKARPAAAPDYTKLSNEQLIELLRSRMVEVSADAIGRGEVTVSAIVTRATPVPKDLVVKVVDDHLARHGGDFDAALRSIQVSHLLGYLHDGAFYLAAKDELESRRSAEAGGVLRDIRKTPRADLVFIDTSVLVESYRNRAGGDLRAALSQLEEDREVVDVVDHETWMKTMNELTAQLAQNDSATAGEEVLGAAARKNAKRPPKGPREQGAD